MILTTHYLMNHPATACQAFAWIGQSFAHCDDCNKPYWWHTHRYALGEEKGPAPFDRPYKPKLKVISRSEAARVKAKWAET